MFHSDLTSLAGPLNLPPVRARSQRQGRRAQMRSRPSPVAGGSGGSRRGPKARIRAASHPMPVVPPIRLTTNGPPAGMPRSSWAGRQRRAPGSPASRTLRCSRGPASCPSPFVSASAALLGRRRHTRLGSPGSAAGRQAATEAVDNRVSVHRATMRGADHPEQPHEHSGGHRASDHQGGQILARFLPQAKASARQRPSSGSSWLRRARAQRSPGRRGRVHARSVSRRR